jgi:hypothetical protein
MTEETGVDVRQAHAALTGQSAYPDVELLEALNDVRPRRQAHPGGVASAVAGVIHRADHDDPLVGGDRLEAGEDRADSSRCGPPPAPLGCRRSR